MCCAACGAMGYKETKVVVACMHITPSHQHHYPKLLECIEYIKCLSSIFCQVGV